MRNPKNSNNSDSFQGLLLKEAANVTVEGISISNMLEPDQPLIYVNRAFETLTGYSKNEVLGKNCRFLQGVDTDEKAVQRIREAILNKESCTVELLNYKKNGTPFWNRLSITPIEDKDGLVTHYVGVQSDITELRNTKERLEKANNELSLFREKILKELEQARIVQQYLLPSELPRDESLGFATLFVPMEQIGGDFFDIVTIKDGTYGLLIADVVGHGIPAALLTFMSATTFKNSAPGSISPAKTISQTNKRLFGKMPDDAFVTMFYAVYDSTKRELKYTQAGHPEAFLIRTSSGEVVPLQTGGTLLGVFSDDEVTYTEKTIILRPGDKLILYTDAVSEAMNKEDPLNEDSGLKRFLLENTKLPIKNLFDIIYEQGLELSKKDSYPDDFTMIGFEISCIE